MGRRNTPSRRRTKALAEALEPRYLLTTIYVDASAPGPTHDGSSWVNAYTDLRAALIASNTYNEVHVAHGTYLPTTGTDRTLSFPLKSWVNVYGGYAGYGAANPNARDPSTYPTILSGDIGVPGNSADNSYHVVDGTGAGDTIDGFTITAGHADGTSTNSQGAALIGFPDASHCSFTNNFAINGGAIYGGGGATINSCTFIGNSATTG